MIKVALQVNEGEKDKSYWGKMDSHLEKKNSL